MIQHLYPVDNVKKKLFSILSDNIKSYLKLYTEFVSEQSIKRNDAASATKEKQLLSFMKKF